MIQTYVLIIRLNGAVSSEFPGVVRAPGSATLLTVMGRSIFLALLFCTLVSAQGGDAEILAPYYPTPETIVEKMLQLGGLKAGEKMFDLGSGDGRIVIMAAQKFHADANGVELKKDLVKDSLDRIRKLGLEKSAHIA